MDNLFWIVEDMKSIIVNQTILTLQLMIVQRRNNINNTLYKTLSIILLVN